MCYYAYFNLCIVSIDTAWKYLVTKNTYIGGYAIMPTYSLLQGSDSVIQSHGTDEYFKIYILDEELVMKDWSSKNLPMR